MQIYWKKKCSLKIKNAKNKCKFTYCSFINEIYNTILLVLKYLKKGQRWRKSLITEKKWKGNNLSSFLTRQVNAL